MNPFTIIDLNLVYTMKEFIHTHCYWEEVLFGYMWSQKKSFLVICDPRRSPFLLYVIPEDVLFGYMWSQKKSFLVICDPRRSPFWLCVIPEEVLFGYMWSQKKSYLVICDPRRSPFWLYVIPEEVLFGYMWSQKKSFLVKCDPRRSPFWLYVIPWSWLIDTLYQNVWWIISWIMYHSIHSLHVTSLNQWVRVKYVGVGNQCYVNVSWLMVYVNHLELIFIGITSYRTVDDDDFKYCIKLYVLYHYL